MSAPDRTALPPSPPAQAPQLGEDEARWRKWTAFKFPERGYLAIQAAEEPATAALLLSLAQVPLNCGSPAAVMLVALDGAAEFSRECARCHHYNGADGFVEAKDGEFYRRVAKVVDAHGGSVLPSTRDGTHRAGDRLFQDACAAVFAESAIPAVSAALELHRYLEQYNRLRATEWRDELHARVVVARTWSDALPCLRYVWRDRTVIESKLWQDLPDEVTYLISTLGATVAQPSASGVPVNRVAPISEVVGSEI